MLLSKRLVLALLVVAMFGVSACSDATGPRPDSQPCEQQGTGGRTCQ